MTRAIKDTDSQRLCIHIPDSEVGRHRDSCRVRAREVLEPSFSSHRPSFHRTPRHRTGCRRSCRRLPVPCRRMRLRPLWCDLGCGRGKKLGDAPATRRKAGGAKRQVLRRRAGCSDWMHRTGKSGFKCFPSHRAVAIVMRPFLSLKLPLNRKKIVCQHIECKKMSSIHLNR